MFQALIHVAFYTNRMEEMMDFYQNKLGGALKVLTRYGVYRDRPDRPAFQKIALEAPDRIFNVYIELAPGQSIELFPAEPSQKPHTEWCEHADYTHFALLTDDIFRTRTELASRGLDSDTDVSKGPSGTWQMWYHDPDGNRFEIMQYTESSYQVIGHIESNNKL